MTQAAATARSSAGGRLLGMRLRLDALPAFASAALIAYLALVPLLYLLWRTLMDEGEPTLRFFREAYSAFGLSTMLANSLVFAAGSTALALALGAALAFLVVRTDLPGKTGVVVCAIAPLAIPGVLYTIAWIFLASPRSGALNRLLEPAFGPGTLDVFGMGGMIVVEAFHLTPLVFLLMAAAFRSMDPALEESALASGARPPTVLRLITLPLVRPALLGALLITVVRALESFEVPALLGIPGNVWVFTSRIWRTLGQYPFDLGEAGAYALSLLVLTAAGVFATSRLTRRERRFQTISGRGRRPRAFRLGRWRAPAIAFVSVFALVTVVLPILILVYVSTQPYYRPPSLESLSEMSFGSYADVLGSGETLRVARNSVVLGVCTATAVMLAMAAASWLTLRTKTPGRRLIEQLAFLPIAVPGLVLGVALLFVYLRFPLPVYGTLWLLLIAYVTRLMPYGMRFATASMAQVGRELEESARVAGANWRQTFRRVLLPLLAPGLVAGWITVFVLAVRELSSSIVLYSPGNEVLAIKIWEQYESGRFSDLAALGVVMIVGLGVLVAVAYRLGGRPGLREIQ